MEKEQKKILEVLKSKTLNPPPIWLMRQAGRYLPEYKKIRKKAKNFLDMCYTPEYSVELSLQPIHRYKLDAAILFSDILVIPDALGRNVRFLEKEGPRLDPISPEEILALKDNNILEYLSPVIKTVSSLRKKLSVDTTLIGFCGAPWTVATYMIAGCSTVNQSEARLFSYHHPKIFKWLLDFLSDVSADYLVAQIMAGADVIQIFDTCAGVLSGHEFELYAAEPVARMIASIRKRCPNTPIIAFAKGAGYNLKKYRFLTHADAIGLDWTVPLSFAVELQKEGPVQGNLDPMCLVAGGQIMKDKINAILDSLGSGPLIFNLGHGVTPQVDPQNVAYLVEIIRKGLK
ncbi:uroporphyrinogen decarboxylase [Liberibacter crescens]|nr:uroporphyrinogen decarboxylase [Liberibacter crescens]AMC13266.1 uroporphyrinogen decarboxylase [Liberibacter crescens]